MGKKSRMRMRGGFLDGLSNSASSLWTSTKNATTNAANQASSGASGFFGTTKKEDPKKTSSNVAPSVQPIPSSMPGGKRRRHVGGNNLAATAAPFNVKTAQAQVMVGGKTRKRKRTMCRSKHRKGSKCRSKHRKRG